MSYSRAQLRHTGRIGLITGVLGLALAAGIAGPATATGNGSGPLDKPQPLSNADQNPGGANGQCPGGPYCSTRDGSPSMNGSGTGTATGKPAAGSVGKADNKNPKGQMPNGSDHNAGYECDRNKGIGKGNPAHTGCTSSVPPVVTPPGDVPPVVTPPGDVPPVVTPPGDVPPVVTPPGDVPPVVTPPGDVPPVVTPPGDVPPVVTPPGVVTPPVVTPVVNIVEQPSIAGTVAAAPAAAARTNPLPTSAAAGQASTGGQLIAAAGVAFAASLALGAGFVLRRRNGVA
jgi:hypothetical protein